MSKEPKLNAIQLRKLETYERFFDTAIRSGYSSYPGQEAIDRMRDVWKELTGKDYAFRAGCSTCIFNLVHDIGTLYRAQRPIGWKEKKEAEKATREAAKTAGQGKAQTEDGSPAEGSGTGKEEEE